MYYVHTMYLNKATNYIKKCRSLDLHLKQWFSQRLCGFKDRNTFFM